LTHQYPSVSISFQEEYDEALKEYKSSEGYKKYLGFMDIIGTHNKTITKPYASSMSSSGHVCEKQCWGFGGLCTCHADSVGLRKEEQPLKGNRSQRDGLRPKDSLWNGLISCGIEWN
jgi:hypothetical protein